MGNGWHEWPLVIFTVLGQCVVGALIVSGIGWFAAKNDADRQRIVRGMFFLWLLMGIGFIASVMHLGSPLRAFNSLNRIGASGLSNEGWRRMVARQNAKNCWHGTFFRGQHVFLMFLSKKQNTLSTVHWVNWLA